MKTLNYVTISLICTMLGAAAVNFTSAKLPKVGRGTHQLARYQPWGPGWARPQAQKLDASGFKVEAL